jgi:hypothetical protein
LSSLPGSDAPGETQEGIDMTKSQREALTQLANEGYAIILWTPEELGNAPVRKVEEMSIQAGYDIIESLGGPAYGQEEST